MFESLITKLLTTQKEKLWLFRTNIKLAYSANAKPPYDKALFFTLNNGKTDTVKIVIDTSTMMPNNFNIHTALNHIGLEEKDVRHVAIDGKSQHHIYIKMSKQNRRIIKHAQYLRMTFSNENISLLLKTHRLDAMTITKLLCRNGHISLAVNIIEHLRKNDDAYQKLDKSLLFKDCMHYINLSQLTPVDKMCATLSISSLGIAEAQDLFMAFYGPQAHTKHMNACADYISSEVAIDIEQTTLFRLLLKNFLETTNMQRFSLTIPYNFSFSGTLKILCTKGIDCSELQVRFKQHSGKPAAHYTSESLFNFLLGENIDKTPYDNQQHLKTLVELLTNSATLPLTPKNCVRWYDITTKYHCKLSSKDYRTNSEIETIAFLRKIRAILHRPLVQQDVIKQYAPVLLSVFTGNKKNTVTMPPEMTAAILNHLTDIHCAEEATRDPTLRAS